MTDLRQYALSYWSPVKTGRTYRIRSVRQSVSQSGTAYLKNRSMDFSEIWYEVRIPGGLERHTAAF